MSQVQFICLIILMLTIFILGQNQHVSDRYTNQLQIDNDE